MRKFVTGHLRVQLLLIVAALLYIKAVIELNPKYVLKQAERSGTRQEGP